MLAAATWWSYPLSQFFMGVAMLLCDWLGSRLHTEIFARAHARRTTLPTPVLIAALALSHMAEGLGHLFKLLACVFFALFTVALLRG